MHNGEKGIWEKWTLFDESTRVPLLIYHPLSPFKGQQYTHPVELVDIYPTLLDLAGVSYPTVANGGAVSYNPLSSPCFISDRKCPPLDGLSLAPVVLGSQWQSAQPILSSINDKNVQVIQLQGLNVNLPHAFFCIHFNFSERDAHSSQTFCCLSSNSLCQTLRFRGFTRSNSIRSRQTAYRISDVGDM